MREIGQALGVATVLEGSVRREGDRVAINVQLVNTRTDQELWANHYDRKLADSIGLQGELASQIATALQAELAPEEKARLEVKPTGNPEAYALYLGALGRERTVNQSTEDVTAAAQLYAEAIALDPKFALAHARLSVMNNYLAYEPSDNSLPETRARAEAEEALRLSPSLGEAHLALGLCLYAHEKDHAAAFKEFSIAAATLPNEANIPRCIAGFIASKDAGVKRSPPSSGPRVAILATAMRSHERPTITFLCVIGPAGARATSALCRSRRIPPITGSALLISRSSVTRIPRPAESYSMPFLPEFVPTGS